MKRVAVAVACLSFSICANAQVYKCVVNGKQTFSDVPCATDAQKIQITPSSGRGDPELAAQANEKTKTTTKRNNLNDEISSIERRIKNITTEKNERLAVLAERKSMANNNLAGATLEQSIATEMQAVATDYNARIDRATKDLEKAKAERAALDK